MIIYDDKELGEIARALTEYKGIHYINRDIGPNKHEEKLKRYVDKLIEYYAQNHPDRVKEMLRMIKELYPEYYPNALSLVEEELKRQGKTLGDIGDTGEISDWDEKRSDGMVGDFPIYNEEPGTQGDYPIYNERPTIYIDPIEKLPEWHETYPAPKEGQEILFNKMDEYYKYIDENVNKVRDVITEMRLKKNVDDEIKNYISKHPEEKDNIVNKIAQKHPKYTEHAKEVVSQESENPPTAKKKELDLDL